jgi:gentisate 1,2-dioxygenase
MVAPTLNSKMETNAESEQFYGHLDQAGTKPLWKMLGEVVSPMPRPAAVPALWSYDVMRPLLMEAGRLIDTREAKRRVLLLENPGLRDTRITSSLLAGLQLVLPGEIAPAHRHVAAAVRLVIEGTGAYTTVSGERIPMTPGDFIVTPSWSFHDHGNFTQDPVIWLDALDIPTVGFFDASFAEPYEEETYPVTRLDGDSHARYGENLVPLEYHAGRNDVRMYSYPYSQSRKAIERTALQDDPHPCHCFKMQFINPITGGYPVPTMAAFIQKLNAGFRGQPYRGTDSTVYVVLEGSGLTKVGDQALHWKPNDIFVTPSWSPVAHSAESDAILFSFSDRAAQKALGIWREQILDPSQA